MGNEMGNNNSSALQEEVAKTQAQEKGWQEPSHVNNVIAEKDLFPSAETKDYQEIEPGLSLTSHHPNADTNGQATNGEPEESEDQLADESPKDEMSPTELGGQVAEVLSSAKSMDHEEETRSRMDELSNLDSFKKGEEEIVPDNGFEVISLSDDPKPQNASQINQQKFDTELQNSLQLNQQESAEFTVVPLEVITDQPSGIEIIPFVRSSLAIEKNGHPLETNLTANQDELDLDGFCGVSEGEKRHEEPSIKDLSYEEYTVPSEQPDANVVRKEILSNTLNHLKVTDQGELDEKPNCPGNDSYVSESEAELMNASLSSQELVSGKEHSNMKLLPDAETESLGQKTEEEEDKHDIMDEKKESANSVATLRDPASNEIGGFRFVEANLAEYPNEGLESQFKDATIPNVMSNKEQLLEKQISEVAPVSVTWVAEETEIQRPNLIQSIPLNTEAYQSSASASSFLSEHQVQEGTSAWSMSKHQVQEGTSAWSMSKHQVQATRLTEESIVLPVGFPIEKSHQAEKLSSENYTKMDTSLFSRHSTETNPGKVKMHSHVRRTSSFDFDLRMDTRSEESDRTPLLYQGKNSIDLSLQYPSLHAQNGQELDQYQSLEVEDKVIILERSDSEKSRTPFIGVVKGEEVVAPVVNVPNSQENCGETNMATKNLNSSIVKEASSKSKEKHKRRSSIFGSCICCATVTN